MPEISLSKARSIVRGILKKGRELEFQPLAVVVVLVWS